MIYREEKENLFKVDNKYYLAHCISSDVAMGKGIATQFERYFNIKKEILRHSREERIHPTCISTGRIFNLITKEKYWHKPTYETVEKSLLIMKELIIRNNIKYLAMPTIASGLDGLKWSNVKKIIKSIFYDVDIEILICRI